MVAAAALWGAVLLALALGSPAVPAGTVAAAAAFLAFFVVFSAHYDRTWIDVTPEGLVFHSVFRALPVRWDEILAVEVRSGLAGTLYAVLTRRGRVQFTSLLARHRELLHVVLERAGLVPRR